MRTSLNRFWARRISLALLLLALSSVAQAQNACRQALVLGLDVSGSVDAQEYRLQLDGLAAALSHPEVTAALLAMPSAPVRLSVFEWSGPDDQHQTLAWTAITDRAHIDQIASTLRQIDRQSKDISTALGAAMQHGAALLDQQSGCWKRTLDLSGDGTSNTGPTPRSVRGQLPPDITLNALVIGADAPNTGDDRQQDIAELSSYFAALVIHGPDAFVETALGFTDFEAAMVRKLLRELEGLQLSAQRRPPSAL